MTTVTLELPEELLSGLRSSPEEFVKELRLSAALHWYEHGQITLDSAARLAGVSRTTFLATLNRDMSDAFEVDLS